MIVRGRDFDEIYDLVGVRVLVDTVRDCYAVLGALHARWNPVPGRFKDYIAMPKFNMYQSLHTTVIGPEGKPVEIQIRTHEMHRRAEYGVAAHWKYKERGPRRRPGRRRDDAGATTWPGCASSSTGSGRPSDPGEFLDSLRFEINAQEVYVFTPKGDVVGAAGRARPRSTSPTRCTPRSGTACMGARVNGRLVPLESTLDNGDVVEIFTSKAGRRRPEPGLADVRQEPARPQQDPAVVHQGAPRGGRSSRARTRSPRRCASRTCRCSGCMSHESLVALAHEMRYPDVSALYAAVGEGHVSAADASSQRLVAVARRRGGRRGGPRRGRPPRRRRPTRRGSATPASSSRASTTSGSSSPSAARRCPATRSSASSPAAAASRCTARDCSNVAGLRAEPERIVDVEWAPTLGQRVPRADPGRGARPQPAALRHHPGAVGQPRQHPRRDRPDQPATGWRSRRFTFEMGDPAHLDHVLTAVRRVEGVFDVYRVTGSSMRPE